ncbi:Chaperone protein DnaK [Poriferisphaera corsica]|uniref:Chaperone protein DnaK n=1 Tax=Poriferisphaera corsica TaxID=2528020 RepID=A0A517YXW9_9BACT|nr:Hsp70 family protein [Poriferisphaera corsica]QDU35065.1 Chaperone protein DnaK [Poriferisphaera corsica]
MRKEKIIGIDLGTTNSLVAYCDEKGPRILGESLPSVVRLSVEGDVEAIGGEARRHAVEYPERTIHSAKRLMGRGLKDIEGELGYLAYEVVAGAQDTARVHVGKAVVSPQEISAMILGELKGQAERELGEAVKKAVVTVPAYFDDAQRQATRDAGRLAGLDVVRIVNEPTAAALAYGLGLSGGSKDEEESESSGISLVSGISTGGSSGGDVSLNVKVNPEACESGADDLRDGSGADLEGASDEQGGDDTNRGGTVAVYDLGGGTFDVSIMKLNRGGEGGSVDQVLGTAGDTHLGGDDVDRLLVEMMQGEIREQFFDGKAVQFPASTRQAFRNFAEAMKIRLSNEMEARVEVQVGEGQVYERVVKRDEFEGMIDGWVAKTLVACGKALKGAGLSADEVERVVMVGGSTRIPYVRQKVSEYFGVQCYTALNPDEVVAMGAAVQGAVLMGVKQDMLLLDVIPLGLGIETMGGAVAKLITSNTTIPTRATEIFSTYVDGQTNVKIHVLQGERELVEDCRSLGEFELRGIPAMPAGLPKIEVMFLVDANGVLNVMATEVRSGKRASIQIIPNHGLTRDEVELMEKEGFEHAVEDMNMHRLIDLRMNSRLDIRNIKKQLERVADEIDEGYKREIDDHMAKVQGYIDADGPNGDEFQEAMTAMDHATIRLAEMNIKKTLRDEGLDGQ